MIERKKSLIQNPKNLKILKTRAEDLVNQDLGQELENPTASGKCHFGKAPKPKTYTKRIKSKPEPKPWSRRQKHDLC